MTDSIAFDHAADFYDETRSFPPGVADRVGALFRDAGNLTPNSRVIEVGIGTDPGRGVAGPDADGRRTGAVGGLDHARPAGGQNEGHVLVDHEQRRLSAADRTGH